MLDITKCTNDNCPIKKDCYRYISPPETYQYYSDFKYNDGCEYYMEKVIA